MGQLSEGTVTSTLSVTSVTEDLPVTCDITAKTSETFNKTATIETFGTPLILQKCRKIDLESQLILIVICFTFLMLISECYDCISEQKLRI